MLIRFKGTAYLQRIWLVSLIANTMSTNHMSWSICYLQRGMAYKYTLSRNIPFEKSTNIITCSQLTSHIMQFYSEVFFQPDNMMDWSDDEFYESQQLLAETEGNNRLLIILILKPSITS